LNRAKLLLRHGNLRQLLNLHDDVRLIGLVAHQDPLHLEVIVEGERFPPSHADEEAHTVQLWECQPIPERDLLRMAKVGAGASLFK
jgi:hypothetical protein